MVSRKTKKTDLNRNLCIIKKKIEREEGKIINRNKEEINEKVYKTSKKKIFYINILMYLIEYAWLHKYEKLNIDVIHVFT